MTPADDITSALDALTPAEVDELFAPRVVATRPCGCVDGCAGCEYTGEVPAREVRR